MIADELLDGPLNVIRFHNTEHNQDFDTDWILDMNTKQIEDMVFTLHAYGYITYKNKPKSLFKFCSATFLLQQVSPSPLPNRT
ncbi:hypothetical protein CE91St12_29120 [Bacteroides uniformis]|uniref:Uncharacterized protein n=1 Tax=Bacteroides uniformis TaxID=820 RepID=A0AA37JUV1_BACUN|nr:hypothetical protein CE91St12_29120 [Bacteroides uniformis]GKH38041.1 hypothetical protein CE91St13_29120 [Bacteroides uniformis]